MLLLITPLQILYVCVCALAGFFQKILLQGWNIITYADLIICKLNLISDDNEFFNCLYLITLKLLPQPILAHNLGCVSLTNCSCSTSPQMTDHLKHHSQTHPRPAALSSLHNYSLQFPSHSCLPGLYPRREKTTQIRSPHLRPSATTQLSTIIQLWCGRTLSHSTFLLYGGINSRCCFCNERTDSLRWEMKDTDRWRCGSAG